MKMKEAGRRQKENLEAPRNKGPENISSPNSCKYVNSHQIPLDRQSENMSQHKPKAHQIPDIIETKNLNTTDPG